MDLPETRYSLIARLARAEDVEAWNEFVQTYRGAVLRFCRARGLQDADASEVAQEVFLATQCVAETWEPSGHSGSFRAWLFETARRICLKKIRERSADSQTLSDTSLPAKPSDSDGDNSLKDWQMWAFFAAAEQVQRQVQPNTWQAFWRTTVDGASAQKVANELDMSVGGVYAARCRVMERMRNFVQELSIE